MVLRRDPLCRACGHAISTEVDHIVPKARGGTDEESNLQGLCSACHAAKTARDRYDPPNTRHPPGTRGPDPAGG